MGFDWSRREARARKADEHARRALEEATARWEPDAARLRELIATARTLGTDRAPALPPGCPVALKSGEIAYYWLPSVSLIETNLERDDCNDGYSGCSLHALRNVEWLVGSTRDGAEPAPEAPVVLDVGSVTITNRRIVFQGAKHARGWAFSKLVGTQDDTSTPWTAFAVSKQQKVLGVQYTEDEAEEFRFRLHLALAEQQGNRAAVVAALEHERVEHDAARPVLSVPGYQQPESPPLRGYDAWPRWARITVPIFTVVVLGVLMGVVTGGEARSTYEAESPLSSLLSARPPGPSVTTTVPRRITTTKVAASRPRKSKSPASPPTTAGRVRVRVRRPDGSVVFALSPPPPKSRGHSSRKPSPPTTGPRATSPPTTGPPTTTPPTDPPTTTPPTDPPTTTPPTDPPTTTPPTDPPGPDAMVPGALCSPLGSTGVTADGSPVLCVLELDGLDIEFRWILV